MRVFWYGVGVALIAPAVGPAQTRVRPKELAPVYYPPPAQSASSLDPRAASRRVASDFSPGYDAPFDRLPEVTSVPISGDTLSLGALDNDDRPRALGRYTFDRPAHFPMPGFDALGCPSDRPGLLIYEGMRVAVREKGQYDVNLTVSIPDRPVTLRLQLKLVFDREQPGTYGKEPVYPPPRVFTLTLPPIELNPVQRAADLDLGQPPLRDTSRLTFYVNHQGYSSLLEDFEDEARQVHAGGVKPWRKDEQAIPRKVELYRDGSARFGTTPPKLFDR